MELTVSELPYDEQASVLSCTSRSVSPSSFSTIKMQYIILILFLEAFIF